MKKSAVTLFACMSLISTTFSQEEYKKVNTNEIIQKGIALNDEKKYDEAIIEFKKVHRNDSNFVFASIELINTYLSNHQDSMAIKLCDELLKQKNDYTPNAFLFKANALDNLKKYDEAEKIYKQGAKEYPVNCSFIYELGVSKLQQGKHYEANNLFIQAIKINPVYPASHFQMASLAISQGKLIPAMLAYQYYLICDSKSKRALKVIDMMESLAKIEVNADSLITINELSGENDFSELESIFKSKVALSAKYKSKTDMGYDVVKQMQLITENIGKYKDVSGFYNSFYGKIFADIWSSNYFEPYVYSAFSGINNDAVKKIVEKNKKAIDLYEIWAYNYICVNKATYSEYLKDKMVDVPHWLYNNKITAAGIKNSKQNNEGYWNFYYDNGIKKSEGSFIDDKKDGLWKFYFQSGDIKEEVVYKNGEQTIYRDFFYNNNPKTEYNIRAGLVEDKATVYYTNGKPQATFNYINNKVNGIEKRFYRNGALKYEIKNIDGKYEGDFTEYYDNGKINEKCVFINNKREGAGKGFHNNEANSIYSEGIYKNGSTTGIWKFYHKNGKLSSEGSYKEGEKDGLWKGYFDTGILSEEENYSNGKLDGANKNYNEDGTLWEEYLYKKGKLLECKVYKNNGELIKSDKVNGKNFAITLYNSNGKKRKVGTVTDGDLDGTWKFYSKFDVLEKEMNYSNGKLNGKQIDYFINGNKYLERNYVNGVEKGIYKMYYINGQLKKEGWVVDDQEEGYWKKYYVNGNLEEVNYYNNGGFEGWIENRDEKGKLQTEDFYELGCITQVVAYDTIGNVVENIKMPGGNGILEIKFKDGKVRFHRDFVNDYVEGKSVSYFPNGQLQSQRIYKNGKAIDKQTNYDVFGKVISESNYFNGMLNGKKTEYSYDGKIDTYYNYEDDEKEGKAFSYHPNGKVLREMDYRGNELHGNSKVYDEFGQLVYQRLYDKGLLLSYSYNDVNGNLLPFKKLESGDMKVVCYFTNGKKAFEGTYFNGELNGHRVIYSSNGNVSADDNFVFGVSHGLSKEYYANGNIKAVQNFYYGEETGLSKEYYENGNLRMESNYLIGTLNGPRKFYDESGKLVKTLIYYCDIPMSIQ